MADKDDGPVKMDGPELLRLTAEYMAAIEHSAACVAAQLETLARGPGNFAIADELLRLARVARGEESPDEV